MIRANLRLLIVALLGLALAGCMRAPSAGPPLAERDAIAARMMSDIRVLASDEFGGRKPGTIGEALTLSYITQRMQEVGLVSGTNDPGSAWRAPVKLVSSSPQSSRITLSKGRRNVVVSQQEAAAFTPRRRELAQGGPSTGVTVFFVGRDPETISDEQAAGAIIVLLADTGDSFDKRKALFEKRASAVLSVVADQAALAKVRRSYADERVQLAFDEESHALNGFVTESALSGVLGKTRWQDLRRRVTARSFTPVALDLGVSIEATSQRREFVSHNLLGKIAGKRPDAGAVLLLAHWDHLGECGEPEAEDRICNGAVDNASGVAAMLELARRLAAGPRLDRDIYVLATTAEEVGLLGAKAFTQAPPIPLDRFVAAFNFDTVAVAPPGGPIGFIGRGRTPLDSIVLDLLAKQRRQTGNKDFAESFLKRQDGWALLQEGVPAVLISSAFASREVLGSYLSNEYHLPTDTGSTIELGGAIEDLLLHEKLVRQIADINRYPGTP